MKGRKPALRVVPSTPGTRPAKWPCPTWLPAGAAPVWRSAVDDLAERGLLAEAAKPLLEAYVLSVCQIRQLQAQLAAEQLADEEKINPRFNAMQKAIQSARLLATELSLTVARRGGVRPASDDDFADLDL
jgi:phage terminase small subunit